MRSAVVLLTLAVAAVGCAPSAPLVPPADAGPRADGGRIDGSIEREDGGYQRPDAPRLPTADLAVELPYGGPEAIVDLEAGTSLGRLDVVFSIDTTGSFGGEIDALQTDLSDRIVPALEESVGDVAFGVSRFEDMPFEPVGAPDDRPFTLLTAITTDLSRVSSAVAQLDLPLGNGSDLPESGYEALYQIATGEGLTADGMTLAVPWSGRAATGGGTEPGVGFREGSLRVVVHVTDAPSHDAADYAGIVPDAHGFPEAIGALQTAQIHVIGVASGDAAREHLEALATGTGSVIPPEPDGCHTGRAGRARPPTSAGCPLVFDVDADGSGLSDAIVDAIRDLTSALSYRETYGEAVDDRLAFVRAIEALEATPPDGEDEPARADLRPSDGIDDTFQNVRSGTEVRFRAHLQNLTIAPADYDQVFRVVIRVLGDGLVLVTRTVRITVPAGRLDAGPSDAGARDASIEDASSEDAGTDDASVEDADDAS